MVEPRKRPRIGIALGGGAARGWAHIGVLKALEDLGIRPDVICGTSIGALVGGIAAAGKLHELTDWVTTLGRREVLGLVDFSIGGGGVIGLHRLMRLYRERIGDPQIEELSVGFAAVATDLSSWAEVWLRSGSMLSAIRASIAIPGVFTPVRRDGRWLVDGGLVNPVPVSVCRALGADIVLAVDLQVGPGMRTNDDDAGALSSGVVIQNSHGDADATTTDEIEEESKDAPTFTHVVVTALDIMQYRIGRSRLAGDPPDLLLTPRVGSINPLVFTDGQPTIDEGYDTVRRMSGALRYITRLTGAPEPAGGDTDARG